MSTVPSMPRVGSWACARESLTAHAAEKGLQIRARYGPELGGEALRRILGDRACVRYPCTLAFDSERLLPGECAHAAPRGDRPEAGFTLYIHPVFEHRWDAVARLVLYQLVVVNYGAFASSEDAEVFGASACGQTREAYYQAMCRLADELADAGRFHA